MGSSKGTVPRQLRGAIHRHHQYAKVDVEISDDVVRRMKKGEPTPRYLRSQFGLSYGHFGYSNVDPGVKERMEKTKEMQTKSGATYMPSDGMVPSKWKDQTVENSKRGHVTHCNGI